MDNIKQQLLQTIDENQTDDEGDLYLGLKEKLSGKLTHAEFISLFFDSYSEKLFYYVPPVGVISLTEKGKEKL